MSTNKRSLQDRVANLLRDYPKVWLGPNTVARALNHASSTAVTHVLEKLVDDGYAVRSSTKVAKYSLAPARPPTDCDEVTAGGDVGGHAHGDDFQRK